MTIKMPDSEQKESMDFLFRTRTQHTRNFLEWLLEAREAQITKVKSSTPELLAHAVGELSMLDDVIHQVAIRLGE